MAKSRELYRGIRDNMPLSRELQSSIGKLCKNESGSHFEAARLSNNYVLVNKGLTMT